jgi:hypothetical protein
MTGAIGVQSGRYADIANRSLATHDVNLLRDFFAMQHGLTNARSVRD